MSAAGKVIENKEQERAIASIGEPLLIRAGAGAGKTSTLTRRVVHALSSDAETAPSSVEELLIITFTRKAAAEMVSRIRKALKDAGRPDDMLAIDDAWISTIHAMCSRLLRRYGMLVSVDPYFSLADDAQVQSLENEAFEQVFDEISNDGRWSPCLSGLKAADVFEIVRSLSSELERNAGLGVEACFGPAPKKLAAIAREAVLALDAFASWFDGVEGETDSGLQAAQLAAASFKAASCDITAAMESAHARESAAGANGGTRGDIEDYIGSVLIEAMDSLSLPPRNKGKKTGEYRKAATEAVDAIGGLSLEIALACTYGLLPMLEAAALRYGEVLAEAKRRANVLGNDDLLVYTQRLLNENADVAEECRKRFKMVMVDEFQDTDRLQVSMVDAISGDGLKTLATVGDENQSIYSFRNADLEVVHAHQEYMRSQHACEIVLTRNYRSHADVLAACNSMFRGAFSDLIELEHGRDESRAVLALPPGTPRVRVLAASGACGVENVRRQLARRIAQQFKELITQGAKPGDMALLLAVTTSIDIYADALREAGIPCIVSGGSGFYGYSEIQTMLALLKTLANPFDEVPFLSILASPLVGLDTASLIELRSIRRPRGSEGPSCLDDLKAMAKRNPQRFECAYHQVLDMFERIDGGDVAWALEGIVARSPWSQQLLDAGIEGSTVYANLMKFIDLVRSAQDGGHAGIQDIASYFEAVSITAKEKAGAIVGGNDTLVDGNEPGQGSLGGAVKIMTVHSSKGLEFPIAAVAEFGEKATSDDAGMLSYNDGSRLHMGVSPRKAFIAQRTGGWGGEGLYSRARDCLKASTETVEAVEGSACDESSLAKHLSWMKAKADRKTIEEKDRLFYVACTRARDVLIMGTAYRYADLSKCTYPSLVIEEEGLLGGALPEGMTASVDFGGEASCLYIHDHLERDEATGDIMLSAYDTGGKPQKVAAAACEDAEDDIPYLGGTRFAALQDAPLRFYGTSRQPIFSYTKLSKFSEYALEAARMQAGPAGSLDSTSVAITACASADGSTLDSSIPEEDEAAEDGSIDEPHEDATSFGSAFHLLAQQAAIDRSIERPGAGRLQGACRRWGISDAAEARRLGTAIGKWLDSNLAQIAFAHKVIQPEMPFCMQVGPEGHSFMLEGSLDLFCTDLDGSALIVDYKTGGSAADVPGGLEKRYELQAQCYALAVLESGASHVDIVFVRPEVGSGQPETIEFAFEQAQKEVLAASISAAHERAVESLAL